LSACIDEFQIEQEQRGNTDKHVKERIRKFNSFVTLLKDKPIRALTKPDFVKYADHVVTEYRKRSRKTIRDALKAVEDVLEAARARMEDGVFPEGLDNWLKVLKRERRKRVYKSPRKNRQPMPPDVFQSLLAQADEWAEMDWQKYVQSMPKPEHEDGRVRTLQRVRNKDYARNLKRTGLMTHSMLCLCANAGAIPIDFCRLQWGELVLDGALPLFREDREKPAHLLGEEVARCCPLLPKTVHSLKRWKQYRDAEIEEFGLEQPGHADFVYSNSERRPFDQQDSSGATKLLTKVRNAVDCKDWEIRHLRNIGSTAVRDHRLPEAMAHAWLGHAAGGTNVFYTGEAKDDYLLPLIEVIGATYLNSNV
jgi:integrase